MALTEEEADRFADHVVDVLNSALEADRDAVEALLFGPCVSCNEALASHPSVQVTRDSNGDCSVRGMGLVNSLITAYSDTWGRVAARFRCLCDEHGEVDALIDDPCPVDDCRQVVKGQLEAFMRTPRPEARNKS